MITRLSIGAVGLAGGVWGLWMLSDDGASRLTSVAIWLVGGVVLHDFVLAPVVVLLGVGVAKLVPGHHRAIAAVAFLVWGTLTLTTMNVLLDVGGKPDNDSIMNRHYVTSWMVLTALFAVGVAAAAIIATRRHRRVSA